MQQVSMVGNDLEFDAGIGVCGKAGQSVPVGIGQPTVKLILLLLAVLKLKTKSQTFYTLSDLIDEL